MLFAVKNSLKAFTAFSSASSSPTKFIEEVILNPSPTTSKFSGVGFKFGTKTWFSSPVLGPTALTVVVIKPFAINIQAKAEVKSLLSIFLFIVPSYFKIFTLQL